MLPRLHHGSQIAIVSATAAFANPCFIYGGLVSGSMCPASSFDPFGFHSDPAERPKGDHI